MDPPPERAAEPVPNLPPPVVEPAVTAPIPQWLEYWKNRAQRSEAAGAALLIARRADRTVNADQDAIRARCATWAKRVAQEQATQ